MGLRIGIIFLAALMVMILATYYVLSRNFHRLLTDYSITLTQTMLQQGIVLVEKELEFSRDEVSLLAGAFGTPEPDAVASSFPASALEKDHVLRMVYVTPTDAVASDGRQRDIRGRPDIAAALTGERAMYGPYFDEDGEFVVCYSAPVLRDGKVAGALCIEKDGHLFSKLIAPIRFVDSGESYILNAEGTDIAVSDPNHIDWVLDQYNGRKILAQQEDATTRSIVELEQKALNGETGVDTYLWNDGLVYVAYAPIPSTGWALLGGLREEEIAAMTQSAFYASIANGPALPICFTLFLALTALIVYWIISSSKKTSEINANLKKIANQDALTGLLNRRFLENELLERWQFPVRLSGQAAVFMLDIDDFKKYNDFFGHQKGDDCIRMVAGVFKNAFRECESYVIRYGGEELVATAFLIDARAALEKGREICALVEDERMETVGGKFVTVSVGVCHVSLTSQATLYECIKIADQALYQAKKSGKNRAVLLDAEPAAVRPAPSVPCAPLE